MQQLQNNSEYTASWLERPDKKLHRHPLTTQVKGTMTSNPTHFDVTCHVPGNRLRDRLWISSATSHLVASSRPTPVRKRDEGEPSWYCQSTSQYVEGHHNAWQSNGDQFVLRAWCHARIGLCSDPTKLGGASWGVLMCRCGRVRAALCGAVGRNFRLRISMPKRATRATKGSSRARAIGGPR